MELDNKICQTNVRYFAPHMWGEVTKFKTFYISTYQFNHSTRSALHGVEGHFQKYNVLMELTKELIPKLAEDKEELEKHGFTNALRSKQLAATIETILCELYSAVDCTRKVLVFIYGKYSGINSKKTSRLFSNAENDVIDERVPLEIRNALAEANKDWYPELRKIRVALNHSDVGSCSGHGDKISYYHNDLGKEQYNVLVSEDIFQDISDYANNVNKFLGIIFRCLNTTLKDALVTHICGFFNGGRIYQRVVHIHDAKDFNSGICESYKWFEQDEKFICPFVDTCGAYLKLKEN